MKRYRFPLKSVATVRSLAELRARERFSTALRECNEREQHLEMIRAVLADFEAKLRSGRSGTFRPSEQATALAAFHAETARAAKAEVDLAAARKALEAARQVWLESRRDQRVVEKLEERYRRAYRAEVAREDQLALDERTNAMSARVPASVS